MKETRKNIAIEERIRKMYEFGGDVANLASSYGIKIEGLNGESFEGLWYDVANNSTLCNILGAQEFAVTKLFDFFNDIIQFACAYDVERELIACHWQFEMWYQKAYNETFRNERILNRIVKEMLETMTSEGYSDDMSLVKFCQIKRDLREGKINAKWIWDNLLDNEKDDFCIDLEIALDSSLDFIRQRVVSTLTELECERFEDKLNELQVKLSKINSSIL